MTCLDLNKLDTAVLPRPIALPSPALPTAQLSYRQRKARDYERHLAHVHSQMEAPASQNLGMPGLALHSLAPAGKLVLAVHVSSHAIKSQLQGDVGAGSLCVELGEALIILGGIMGQERGGSRPHQMSHANSLTWRTAHGTRQLSCCSGCCAGAHAKMLCLRGCRPSRHVTRCRNRFCITLNDVMWQKKL